MQAVMALIQNLGVKIVISNQWNHLDGLMKTCFKALLANSKLPQKIAACEMIACLGERLKDAAEHVVPAYHVRFPHFNSYISLILSKPLMVSLQKNKLSFKPPENLRSMSGSPSRTSIPPLTPMPNKSTNRVSTKSPRATPSCEIQPKKPSSAEP